jgi:hypothetical protein
VREPGRHRQDPVGALDVCRTSRATPCRPCRNVHIVTAVVMCAAQDVQHRMQQMLPAAFGFLTSCLICAADGEREAQGGEPAAAGQGGRPHVAAARTGVPACQAHMLRRTDPAHLLDNCMSCPLCPVDWCRCTAGQALLICAPSSRGDCTPAAVTDLTAAQQPMPVRRHLTPWHVTAPLTGNTKRISRGAGGTVRPQLAPAGFERRTLCMAGNAALIVG